MTNLHFLIVRLLSKTGATPISEIGRRLLIPRPQMTHLIDQLIKLGIVERRPCKEDRRVIYVELTEQGRRVFHKCGELLKENIRTKLAYLDAKEICELSAALTKLNEVTAKMR